MARAKPPPKSRAIRQLLESKPGLSNEQILVKLAGQNVSVTMHDIYRVRSTMKKEEKRRKSAMRPNVGQSRTYTEQKPTLTTSLEGFLDNVSEFRQLQSGLQQLQPLIERFGGFGNLEKISKATIST